MRTVPWLLVVLAIAAGLRVPWALAQPAQIHYPDSIGYNMIANNILDGKGAVQGGSTQISRVPAYPVFLSACYKVFGRENFKAARVVQAVIGSLLCLVVYAIAAPVFGRGVAILAALVTAVYPFFVYFSGVLLTETLFTLAFALFLLLVLRIERGHALSTFANSAVTGLLAGVNALLKPSFLLFLPFLGVIWLLVSRRPARALRSLLVIALCTLIIMCPWVVRNWTLTQRFVPTTLTVGKSLWEGIFSGADGGPAMDRIPKQDRVFGQSEYDEDRLYLKMAGRTIRESPGRILALAGRKFLNFWNVIPNSPDHQGFLYRLVSISAVVPILCFAIVGVLSAPIPRGERLIFLSGAIYFTLLHMLFIGSIRYRVPVMPPIIILTAVGVFRLLGRRVEAEIPTAVLDGEIPPAKGVAT